MSETTACETLIDFAKTFAFDKSRYEILDTIFSKKKYKLSFNADSLSNLAKTFSSDEYRSKIIQIYLVEMILYRSPDDAIELIEIFSNEESKISFLKTFNFGEISIGVQKIHSYLQLFSIESKKIACLTHILCGMDKIKQIVI